MVQNATEGKEDVRSVNAEQGCSHTELLIVCSSNKLVYSQAAKALSTNHIRKTIWHRIIRVYMGFSTRYPWILFEEKTGIQKGRLDPVKVAQNSFQHFPRRSF